MQLLLLSKTFRSETHGPARFARFAAELPDLFPTVQLTILTEEPASLGYAQVVPIYCRYPRWLEAFNQVIRAWLYFQQLRQLLRQKPVDVVLVNHGVHGFFLARWLRSAPVVVMINDDEQIRYWEIHAWWQRKRYIRWMYRWMERSTAKRAAATLVNSDYLAQTIIQAYRLRPERVHRLYKGIDVAAYPFLPERAFDRPVRILFVKSDYQRGGLRRLLAALQLLREWTFHLEVVGPPIERMEAVVRPYDIGMNTQFRPLGPLPNPIVQQLLAQADIFCVPAWREALGVGNIEALAAGCPVVTTNVGGIPEVTAQGEGAWLAPPTDPADLALAIRSCLEDPTRRLEKSTVGRSYVEKYFDYRQMLSNLLEILRPVCA